MRPLVIYHGNCLDGFCAAWCFWHKFSSEVDFFPGNFGKPPPAHAGREVFLVDFSYPRETVTHMLASAQSVTLIDHHHTALQDLADLPGLQYFTDQARSGVTLAWDFLFPNQIRPRLLEHVEDRDLWRFALPDTREIVAALFSYEYSFSLLDELVTQGVAALAQLRQEGIVLERKRRKDMQHLLNACTRQMLIGGELVPVANVPWMLASEAAHQLAQHAPFAACYWDTAIGRKFELRSRQDGADVASIARSYGGGGHLHAAGFMVRREHPLACS